MAIADDRTRLAIKASPNGSRAGFALLSDGSDRGVLTVTVLPKPWAATDESGVPRLVQHERGSTTHVVVHELDMLVVATTRDAAQALALSIAELTDGSEEGAVQRRLLEMGRRTSGQVERASLDPNLESLLSLLDLTQHVRSSRLDQAVGGRYSSSILRILEQRRFVAEVEQVIFAARPRYEERTEVLSAPRGRIQERTLLLASWSGVPSVTSTFDELTLNTPILQVVAAALRVTAIDRHDSPLAWLVDGVRQRAARLVHLLQGISTLDANSALRLAERTTAGGLDKVWAPAMRFAQPVLRGYGVYPDDGEEESHGSFAVSVHMEKVWEEWLELAFPTTWNVKAQQPTNVPWAKNPERPPLSGRADFVLALDDGTVAVVDAKYKLDKGGIDSSDGYQLFAYSSLARLDGEPPRMAAILYPLLADDLREGEDKYWRAPDKTFPLWRIGLPFASPQEIGSALTFADYLVRLRTEIERQLGGLDLSHESGFAPPSQTI
jgi:5-methylcytosine-specific restriction endonuclease McrBC regulatory subunit McrC